MTAPRSNLVQVFLRQITYGGNDGIITTFAIVAGFAGAQADGAAGIGTIAVLVFGMANLIADGVSMGLGEYLSDRSTRALFHARAARLSRDHVDETEGDLTRLLADRGLSGNAAQEASRAIATNPDLARDMLQRYRENTAAPEGVSPLGRGMVTFASFLVFGFIPILPFFIAPEAPRTFEVSVAATLIALTLLGILRWRATSEPALRAIGETVLLGAFCAALAYGAGNVMAGLG